jgi:hypothetical protein
VSGWWTWAFHERTSAVQPVGFASLAFDVLSETESVSVAVFDVEVAAAVRLSQISRAIFTPFDLNSLYSASALSIHT